MKAHLYLYTAFCTLATSRTLLTIRDGAGTVNYPTFGDHLLTTRERAAAVNYKDSKWNQALLIGGKLWAGMQFSDRKASFLFKTDPHAQDPMIQTVQSVFDGDMYELFKNWGYNEDDATNAKMDEECDFDSYQHIKPTFDELGIETKSKGHGGPNQCVNLKHYGGSNVVHNKYKNLPPVNLQTYFDESSGKQYRVTGASFEFSVNGKDGMITLLFVTSPLYSAQILWGRNPAPHELPKIRSTSDIAWGFWNRAAPGNLGNIKYLMVASIVNEHTLGLIRQALGTLTPKRSKVEVWPGFDFAMNTPAGQALLGSPVGRWAGYFLMQHKKQLGGNKFITKVKVFNSEEGYYPYMLFYVDDVGPDSSPSSKSQALAAWEAGNTLNDTNKVFSGVKFHHVEKRKEGQRLRRAHVVGMHV